MVRILKTFGFLDKRGLTFISLSQNIIKLKYRKSYLTWDRTTVCINTAFGLVHLATEAFIMKEVSLLYHSYQTLSIIMRGALLLYHFYRTLLTIEIKSLTLPHSNYCPNFQNPFLADFKGSIFGDIMCFLVLS